MLSRTWYYYLRKISRIRRFLSQDACRALIRALMESDTNYANALCCMVPHSTLDTTTVQM